MAVLGFDFGTTNSLISIVRRGTVISFLDEEQMPIPSVVCYEGGEIIAGREAKRRLTRAGLGVQQNVIRSPKMYLGQESIHVEGVERSPVDIVADVVRHVVETSRGIDRSTDDFSSVVVTIPVFMDGTRRRRLRDAFRQAGVRIVQYVHEPLAALYGFFRDPACSSKVRDFQRKPILVFDWGGGTLDLTLCRPLGNTLVQVANDGTDEVGGDVFDDTIKNASLSKYSRNGMLPEIRTDAEKRLLEKCEESKIALSDKDLVSVFVPNFFRGVEDEDFTYQLSRSEMEMVIGPLIDKGFRRIKKILSDADLEPEQVAFCLATGGMANMPIIKRRLHELFGPARVKIPDRTSTLIAEGAAWIAHDGAGLSLAKNIELVLARNSFFPLVKAGTPMPKETEVQEDSFHLYCTDPRDGTAKFQICSPRRPGRDIPASEERVHLENLSINVDSKANLFAERLELDIKIDDDLILTAHARSVIKKGEDKCEVFDLEFGLELPSFEDESEPDIKDEGAADEGEPGDGGAKDDARETAEIPKGTGLTHHEPGSLSLRANVSKTEDPTLVPGEYLYLIDPAYFDARSNPPKYQDLERLYYEPCWKCKRASNDLACKC